MNVRIVTGYDVLNGPRPHEEYVRLGNRLLALPTPIDLFTDWHESFEPGWNTEIHADAEVHWLWRIKADKRPKIPMTDNPEKDTADFHAVQHQKTQWLAMAAAIDPRDTLVWVDLGILHVPGVTEAGILGLVERAANLPQDKVTFASIWGEPIRGILTDRVEWWCAGGVVICPGRLAGEFHAEAMDAAERCLTNFGRITYEVNTWAAAWRQRPALFRHYLCDHNHTILEAA
jgi:hypothetical protein